MRVDGFECGDCGEQSEVRASFEEQDRRSNSTCPGCGSDNSGRVFGGLVFFAKSGRVASSKRLGGSCCSAR